MRFALLVLLVLASSVANAQSTTKDVLRAFGKLESKVETGVNLRDYGDALADANFEYKEYMSSPDAKLHPAIADSLGKAISCYMLANAYWDASLSGNSTMGRPDAFLARYPAADADWDHGGIIYGKYDGRPLYHYTHMLPFLWRDASANIDSARQMKR